MRTKTVVLLLVFIGLLLYFNALFNNFLGDDKLQIINNSSVHSVRNIPEFFTGSTYDTGGAGRVSGIFYRPLMLTFFSLFYSLFGTVPLFYHLFQITLHIGNSILLYFFLRFFFKEKVSFFCAVLFLIHPINTEAVVYSANLQETLFFFFGMSALLLLQKKILTTPLKFGIFFLFLLSLFSKETGVLFLVVSVLFSYGFNKQHMKFLWLSIFSSFSMYLFFRYGLAKMHLAQHGVAYIANATLGERVMNIPMILAYYLKTFLFPITLVTDNYSIVKALTFKNFYLPSIFVFIFIAIVFSVYTRIKTYPRKDMKIFLFFLTWLCMGLLLHMQLIPLDATIADRWFYFPFVGMLGIIGILFKEISIKNKRIKKISFLGIFLIFCLLSYQTYYRIFDWRDGLSLYGRSIRMGVSNFIINNAYGTELIEMGEYEKAKPYITRSVEEFPYYANLNNLAIIYASENNRKMTETYLKKAVDSSQNYMVYENYANYLLVYGEVNKAKDFTTEALRLFPENGKLWVILSQANYLLGKKNESIVAAKRACEIRNDNNTCTLYTNLRNGYPISVLRK